MPLPRALARFNRVALNKVTRPFAARLPGFAVLHHTGRVSGASYATPLNAWRQDDHVVVALTYGEDVDWLRNARARPPSTLVMGAKKIQVGTPWDMPTAQGMAAVPAPVRAALRALDVREFVGFPVDQA